MRRPARTLRQSLRARSGLAAVEFALVAPVAILILVSVMDISNAMWRTMRLEIAAGSGAQYAFAAPQDSAGITNKVLAALPGWTNVTVQPTTMTCNCDNGATVNCTSGICLVGNASVAPILRLSITVTQPFEHVSPFTASLFPGISPLRGNVEVRLR